MKSALWAAARASTMPQFQKAMENLKTLNEQAWTDMNELPAKKWARAAFDTYTKCDLQVNNMCEAFNMAILEYRDKPIITLIEGLKSYLTSRIVKQRELMKRYNGDICPMIQLKIEEHKKQAANWAPAWSGDSNAALFEVSNGDYKYSVDLVATTCSCRRWDLTGIPCCHSIACMWFNNQQPEPYVSSFYR